MLILISMDVQYLQNVFNFKKRPNGQNHASLGSQHPIRKFPTKISNPPRGGGGGPPPLNVIRKTSNITCQKTFFATFCC